MGEVRVKLYGAFRNHFSEDELRLELEEPATVAVLKDRMGELWPSLKPLLLETAVAGDDEFLDSKRSLEGIHEVSLLPPVCGG